MKRSILLICCISIAIISYGQDFDGIMTPQNESGNTFRSQSTQTRQIPISVKNWTIDQHLGTADTCAVDTAISGYQDNNPVYRYSIANSWTGNLGSPVESKIFFDRTRKTRFISSNPYDAYTINVGDVRFFNTKTPYANIVYRTSLPMYNEEDNFRALYSMNFNKYLNVGGLFNFVLGRGRYKDQTARAVNGGLWASYSGKRYEFNTVMMFNDFRNREYGGLRGVDSITTSSQFRYLPTIFADNINAVSTYKSSIFYYNHSYSLGVEKERKLKDGTTATDFVPITSFIHTIKYENARKRYTEDKRNAFYDSTYYSTENTRDSIRYQNLRNTFALRLEEKFNTLLRFGLTAFAEHELTRNTSYSSAEKYLDYYSQNIFVGGELSKNEGQTIKYKIRGRIAIAGKKLGDFSLKGKLKTNLNILRDTLNFDVGGSIENSTVEYFLQKFRSNHFKWDNTFSKTFDIRLNTRLKSTKTGISIGFDLANINNYIYFDYDALPRQHTGVIQVMAFDLEAKLNYRKIHLDSKLVYQISSDKDILPLPDLSLYSALYYKSKFFGVLLSELGVSCRYHTSYYGNTYMPATGQFHLQNSTILGNYPDLSVFTNFHLKRIRFYFQYAHLNMYLFGGKGYKLMPQYPINPATFQMGLSWTFYN